MDKRVLTDIERNNKTSMTAHMIDSAIIVIFIVLQALGGLRGIQYALITVILGFAPVAGEYFFWKKNKATPMIKHLVAIGFAVFYTFILFTSIHSMVYVFVIPMILVISVYNDIRYSLMINTGTILESIIVSVVGAQTGKFGYTGSDSAVIQVVIMILVGIFSYMASKTINENTVQKLENVTEAQNKTEAALKNISELSEKMQEGIENIHGELEKLNHASKATKAAMQEVSSGSADTARAVQDQLHQTQAIQIKVASVDEAAIQITENMQKTLQVLEEGSKNVSALVEKVDVSVQNGADVTEKLGALDKYMKEMHSIVEMINGITNQTSMLALNASIEAARAGEAGKGFAVVASEITGMALRTKDATGNIKSLIDNVSSAIEEVVSGIRQMIEGINEEKQGVTYASDSFSVIEENTFFVRDNIEKLSHNIEELKAANQVITDTVQTISAISEEVSAHAGETMEAEESNAIILDRIADQMNELIEAANH